MKFANVYIEPGETDVRIERVVPCLTASLGHVIATRDGRRVRVVAVSWANQDKPEYVVVDAQGRESDECGHAWIAGRVESAE